MPGIVLDDLFVFVVVVLGDLSKMDNFHLYRVKF